MVNPYLFAAFSVVWGIFFIYAWLLSRRQAKLQNELEDLRKRLRNDLPTGTRSS